MVFIFVLMGNLKKSLLMILFLVESKSKFYNNYLFLSTSPIFSRANGEELWVLFLEKAYAKVYGAYDKIEAGLSGCALRDLTGAPYEYHIR